MSSTDELELLPQGAELLFGTYKLTTPLSRSDFYVTYLAVDKMGQKSLIKECFLEGHCQRDGGDVESATDADKAFLDAEIANLKREAKNLSKLEHENVVKVHQLFEENGTAYMGMKFVDGASLADILDEGRSLSPSDTQATVEKLLSALVAVDAAGLVHRNINPEHIVMRSDDDPVVVGFGRSVEMDGGAYVPAEGEVFETDEYSPNEFAVEGAAQTARSDLYSVGALAYHLVTGQLPLSAQERAEQVAKDKADPMPRLAGTDLPYPAEFLETIDRAVSLDPQARPESAKAWLSTLTAGRAKENEKMAANAAAIGDDEMKSSSKLMYVVSGAVLAAAAGAFIIGSSMFGNSEEQAALAEQKIAQAEAKLNAEKARLEQEAAKRAEELAKKEAKVAVELKVIQEAAATHEKVTAEREAEAQAQFEAQMRDLKAQREQMENAFIERETGFAQEREALEARLAATQAQLASGQQAGQQSTELQEQLAKLEAERDSLRQEAEQRTAALSASQADIEAKLAQAEEQNAARVAAAEQREFELQQQLAERQAELDKLQEEQQAELDEKEKALAEQQKATALLEAEAKQREASLAEQLEKQQAELAEKQEKLQAMLAQLEAAKAEQEKAAQEQQAAKDAAEAQRVALEEKLKASEAAAKAAAEEELRKLEAQMQQEIEAREQAELAAKQEAEEQLRALEAKMNEAIQEKEEARVAANTLQDKLEKASQIERLVAVTEPEATATEEAPVETAALAEPATPAQPLVSETAPSVELLPVDQQIVSEDWSVEIPFGLALSIDSKGKPVFKLSRVDTSQVPSWMQSGLEIHQLNGKPIRRRGDLERALIKAAKQDQATSLTVKRDGQRRMENRLLKLSETGKVKFKGGSEFMVSKTNEGWQALVKKAPARGEGYLMAGDVIQLESSDQLKALVEKAVADKTPEVELSVLRNDNNIGVLLVLATAE